MAAAQSLGPVRRSQRRQDTFSRTSRWLVRYSDNAPSRAHPARGRRKLPTAPDLTPSDRSGRCGSLTAQRWVGRTIGAMGHGRRRHTPEQMIRKLREADRLQGEGQEVASVAKQLEVSEQTLHRWRLQYGGLKADDAKRLKELEKENSRLKQIVADQLLEN